MSSWRRRLATKMRMKAASMNSHESSSAADVEVDPGLSAFTWVQGSGFDRDRPLRVTGRCPICGSWATFDGWLPFRESFLCSSCYGTSRYRSIALGVLRAIESLTGVVATSLAQIPASSPRSIQVLDTQRPFSYPPFGAYLVPELLDSVAWIDVTTSAFVPDLPWGADLGGTATNQTLEALTFPTESLDLLITSDVMEHVRLYQQAHEEIARVLRPGGVYVFTVPHSRAMAEHLTRVQVVDAADASRDVHLLPPEYHGSTLETEGVLSYRVFGTDIDAELDAVGFDVEFTSDPVPTAAIFDTELFWCRRRAQQEVALNQAVSKST